MAGRLAGKVALVTGGASGLGREVVDLMTEEGASVVIFDRNFAGAEKLVTELKAKGRKVAPFEGDVTKPESLVTAIQFAKQAFGRFDIIHNNAGIQIEKPIHDTSDEEYDRVMDINVRGVFNGCRAALQSFLADKVPGAIVNTASIAAHAGDNFVGAYTMSKTALLGLTRAIAQGYAAQGIRANCVSPGDMETPMLTQYWDAQSDPKAARAFMEELYPIKRVAHPREVARVVLFLASDEASFVNGEAIIADGGLLAKLY